MHFAPLPFPLSISPSVSSYFPEGLSYGPVSRGNLSQFGAMCILMGYVGVRAPVVRETVEACLLGDVLWAAAFVPLVYQHGDWSSPGSLFSVLSVIFLAATRLIYLLGSELPPMRA